MRELARAGDVVLIKGSRSARMERIVEGLASRMMYYLYQLSLSAPGQDFLRALNVFQYITFRARRRRRVTAFLLSLMCGNWVIRRLISLKLGQPIRTKEEVNKLFELHGGKAGTPTMGGVLLLGAVIVSSLLWARPDNTAVWLLIFAHRSTAAALGFWDDYLKVTQEELRRRERADEARSAQVILAVIVAAFSCSTRRSKCRRARSTCPFTRTRSSRISASAPSSSSRWSSSAPRMR